MSRQIVVFISHASEDKPFVSELARSLTEQGLVVWFDKWAITVGDSIPRQIDEGLSKADYAVVVLSASYFGKSWTLKELDALLMKEPIGKKLILPIRHDLPPSAVAKSSPLLAPRLSLESSVGAPALASALAEAIRNEEDAAAQRVRDAFNVPFCDVEAEELDVPIAIDIGSHSLRVAVADPVPRCLRLKAGRPVETPWACRFTRVRHSYSFPLLRLFGVGSDSDVVRRTLPYDLTDVDPASIPAYEFFKMQRRLPFPAPAGWYATTDNGSLLIDIKGEKKSPHELLCKLLGAIRERATTILQTEVRSAVICIPYDFDPGQKAAFQDLALSAGFRRVRMIGTGVGACALRVAWRSNESITRVVAVNCGEDRTCVTSAAIDDDTIAVRSYMSVSDLSGAHCTLEAENMIAQHFEQHDVQQDVTAIERFAFARQMKEAFTYRDTAHVRIQGLDERLRFKRDAYWNRIRGHLFRMTSTQ